MDYAKDVLKILGVEVGEPFKVKNANGDYFEQLYCFNNELLICRYCDGKPYESLIVTIQNILLGKYQIVKIPYKPKYGEYYYYIYNSQVCKCFWSNLDSDLINWKIGNVFRTEEEAEAKGKELMDRLRKEYEEA